MKQQADYKERLKNEGLKNTKHRNAVLEILEKSEQPITAEVIFFNLKEQGKTISLSTVYRALDVLVEKNMVIKSSIAQQNKAVFEIHHEEHKHHIVCLSCKKMFSIGDCPFEAYEKRIEDELGFDVKGHKLEIYGYCSECRK